MLINVETGGRQDDNLSLALIWTPVILKGL